MDCRFGRMVTAPSAISSWFSIGEILDPQLSEPTQIKWPVWLAFFAAWRSRLEDMKGFVKLFSILSFADHLNACRHLSPKNISLSFKCTTKRQQRSFAGNSMTWILCLDIFAYGGRRMEWPPKAENFLRVHSGCCTIRRMPHLSRLAANGSKYEALRRHIWKLECSNVSKF